MGNEKKEEKKPWRWWALYWDFLHPGINATWKNGKYIPKLAMFSLVYISSFCKVPLDEKYLKFVLFGVFFPGFLVIYLKYTTQTYYVVFPKAWLFWAATLRSAVAIILLCKKAELLNDRWSEQRKKHQHLAGESKAVFRECKAQQRTLRIQCNSSDHAAGPRSPHQTVLHTDVRDSRDAHSSGGNVLWIIGFHYRQLMQDRHY